jgi:hypothetical protein
VAEPEDFDEDTVLSALLPIDRTVVSMGSMQIDEDTIVHGSGGELDEKTRAVERRALNTGGEGASARVAFAPAERRERYPVRVDGTVLPGVARFDIAPAPARPPLQARRARSGGHVVAAVVIATGTVAIVVGGILTLVFGR